MNDYSVIIAIFLIILMAVSQLLLKTGAKFQEGFRWIPNSLKPYINRYTISAYCILFIVTILMIYILADIPLKLLFPFFISGNLVVITFLSYVVLHESLTKNQIMAIFLILSGILIFYF